MKRTAKDRRPNLRPPKRIEVQEGNTRLRVVLLILCLVIAVSAFTYGVTAFFKGNERRGFTEIPAGGDSSVGGDFHFHYQLGEKGGSALYRELSAFWERECALAYRIFSSEETFAGVGNLASLSESPGETVMLEPALYAALERLEASGVRVQYLAPIEQHYRSIFYSESEAEASIADPRKNPELAAYYAALADFASDPASVQLELLGDGAARLSISEEYRAFAEENEIKYFLSLGYLKNAFVCDYLAARLSAAGYTEGTLTSVDGFTRNLDVEGARKYRFNLFCRDGNGIDLSGKLELSDCGALLSLRTFPISSEDLGRIYLFSDGSTATAYLDPRSGLPLCSTDSLVLYGGNSCTELMLAALPLWVAESLDVADLAALPFEAVWCESREIRCTDPAAPLVELNEKYTKVNIG